MAASLSMPILDCHDTAHDIYLGATDIPLLRTLRRGT